LSENGADLRADCGPRVHYQCNQNIDISFRACEKVP
jgi:hypothetical protein